MTDLAHIEPAGIAAYVRKTHDFAPLAEWLEGGGTVDDTLKQVLADIVSGKLKPSGKKRRLNSNAYRLRLRIDVHAWRAELKRHARGESGTLLPLAEVEQLLKLAGYKGFPEKLADCTAAARKIVGWRNRLLDSQLDDLLVRRKAREPKQFAA